MSKKDSPGEVHDNPILLMDYYISNFHRRECSAFVSTVIDLCYSLVCLIIGTLICKAKSKRQYLVKCKISRYTDVFIGAHKLKSVAILYGYHRRHMMRIHRMLL